MTDILTTIDKTLTFHSAGLGVDLQVPVERDDDEWLDVAEWVRAAMPEYVLAPWQVAAVRATFERVDDTMRAVAVAFSHALPPILRSFKATMVFVDELHQIDRLRRARLRRMHHLYRMRRVR